MAIAVDADRVAGGNDLGRERPVALDLLADQEERRDRASSVQSLEYGRGAVAMRPVVEGACDPAPGRKRARNPKGRGNRPHDGSRRRSEPRRGDCTS